MPYFLNAPASMATNNGACRSDTAGTATLIVFNGCSVAKACRSDGSKAIKEIRTIHRFMVRSFAKLLRSSLVSRHRQIRGEPWKARASESKGSVQARAAGITTSGPDRVGPTRLRPVARAWKGSSLVLKPKCLHTDKLLNSTTRLPQAGENVQLGFATISILFKH